MRVFCRVKNNQNDKQVVQFPLMNHYNKVTTQSIQVKTKQGLASYNFDQVFKPNTNQKQLFNEIEPFIQQALDGQNVSIFAYGQTGSGKTYTIEGKLNKSTKITESCGILPRTAEYIQKEIRRHKNQLNKNLKIEISSIEIYCEQIKDLFENTSPKLVLKNEKKLKDINPLIKNQTWIPLKEDNFYEQFMNYLQISSSKRIIRDNG